MRVMAWSGNYFIHSSRDCQPRLRGFRDLKGQVEKDFMNKFLFERGTLACRLVSRES